MSALSEYANALTPTDKAFASGEVFAKVLTRNDDSGRHGVLIPSDAYSFFPEFEIADPTQNSTKEFPAFNAVSKQQVTLAYKYYERYPERRVTRLDGLLNDLSSSPRLLVVLHAKHADGTSGYYFDCANSALNGRFASLFQLIFGSEIAVAAGKEVF